MYVLYAFFFNDTATTEIYPLSLHDALPILGSTATSCTSGTSPRAGTCRPSTSEPSTRWCWSCGPRTTRRPPGASSASSCRSEEHTSELQSRQYIVWRLLLEKKTPKLQSRAF